MQSYFQQIIECLHGGTAAGDIFLATFAGEDSDFCRFNRSKIRQGGQVSQRQMGLTLIRDERQISSKFTLSGSVEADRNKVLQIYEKLKRDISILPKDPYLNFLTAPSSSVAMHSDCLPPATECVGDLLKAGENSDLVGIFSSGGIFRGFANSLGQFNWFETFSFQVDWSAYLESDRAISSSWCGYQWDTAESTERIQKSLKQLEFMKMRPRELKPGSYRVLLSPAALVEVMQLLNWEGFGAKSLRSKRSPLQKLADNERTLAPSVNLYEDTAQGLAPNFDQYGFRKPKRLPLIQDGHYANALVSARSAKEYGLPPTGALASEQAEALSMSGGELSMSEALEALDTGLYIQNLWYLNYSDRQSCRMTGMTRFGTFWVEGGKVASPVGVMRFDDSLYRMLGSELEALTIPELIVDTSTYGQRSTSSFRLPGALLRSFNLTL